MIDFLMTPVPLFESLIWAIGFGVMISAAWKWRKEAGRWHRLSLIQRRTILNYEALALAQDERMREDA